MSDFDQIVKRYYADKKLPPERLEAILQQGSGRPGLARYYKWAGVAAVLLIGFFGVHRQLEHQTLTEGVLAEIAMNHRKQLGVEVASDQYQVVQAKLDRLDFPILPAKEGLLANYRLVGGRYCSIRGELAALLKVRDRMSGAVFTLYVTPLTEALEPMVPLEQNYDQVSIRLWRDNGRFFALAGDP